jgi:hypothetical protein
MISLQKQILTKKGVDKLKEFDFSFIITSINPQKIKTVKST